MSQGIEKHIGTLREPLVSPERLEHVIFSLADLIIVEDEPLAADADVAEIVPVVLACAEVDDHADQFVESLAVVLVIVGFDFEFEGERHLPVEFGDALLALVVLEPAQVDGEEVRQGFYDRPLLSLD